VDYGKKQPNPPYIGGIFKVCIASFASVAKT